ncbi:hypothetical protein BDZ94DRAFT_613503 [Collybia nuda]|uniref:F-box domain-containing protein n=1 Tax=Collybia nuda TaxID=64659 RepID=A0A9P5Y790_9AGAR|nr:hypothetical protein BDZ94DRAFT_613503 [Collybia nuda]
MGDMRLRFGLLKYPDIHSPRGNIFRFPNNVPNSTEASYAHDLLEIAESELYQLHLDIAVLLTKRAHITKRITNCKAILAPHKNLPSELMSKIFSFVIMERYAVLPLRYGKRDSRLRITQVCSRWRRIAFDTPDLWDLCFPPFSHSSGIELGAYWWSQYSGSKLRFSATYQPRLIPRSKLDFQLVDKLILPFSERLRDIRIAVSTRDLKKLLTAPPGSFNNLEAITLWLHSRDVGPWSATDTALMTAPKLHSVSLSVVTQSWFSPNLPLGQLTQLTLNARIPADVCFILLEQCTSLVNCDFSYIDEDFGSVAGLEPLPDFPLRLPLLNFFAVHFKSGDFSSLLSRLSLPNLSNFLITTNITHHQNRWMLHCKEFFRSMEESLINFEITTSVEDSWQSNPLDEAILWDLPNIQSFIAPQYHPLNASALEKIAQGIVLRKVESLQFYTDNADDVVSMLTTRQSSALSASSGSLSPIKNIQVNCQRTTSGLEDKLNLFRSQGIVIDCVVPYNEPHTTSGDSDSDSG